MRSIPPLRLVLLALALPLPAACAAPSPEAADTGTQALDPRGFYEEIRERAEAAEAAGNAAVPGADGWLYFDGELRSLLAPPYWENGAGEDSGPLPALLDFQAQLNARGIELLLVPVPAKASVYPEKLVPDAPEPGSVGAARLDGAHGAFLQELESRGFEVLDLLPLFLDHRDASQGPTHCRQDTHWSGRGVVLTAERVAARIREKPWFEAVPKRSFESEERQVEIEGDLWRMAVERPAPESLPLRFVGVRQGGSLVPVEPARESPVLVLGDSHGLVFHAGAELHTRGAGIADQLALELGFVVDLVAVRGSGATASRVNLRRRPDGLAGKKLVVWIFSVREFTEGTWKKVPLG